MSIINQNLARSQRKANGGEPAIFGAFATGVTQLLNIIPYDSIITGVNVAAFGLSGSPVWSLSLFRFAGGLTSIPLGATLTVGAVGTSGNLGFTLPSSGFTCNAGDVLIVTSGGANSSVTTSAVTVIFEGRSDINVYQNSI